MFVRPGNERRCNSPVERAQVVLWVEAPRWGHLFYDLFVDFTGFLVSELGCDDNRVLLSIIHTSAKQSHSHCLYSTAFVPVPNYRSLIDLA